MELTFILTEACNLRCTYCYQPEYPETRMAPDIAVRAMEQAIAAGAGHLALTFFGGEPLLQKEKLLEILRAARALESGLDRRAGRLGFPFGGPGPDGAVVGRHGHFSTRTR